MGNLKDELLMFNPFYFILFFFVIPIVLYIAFGYFTSKKTNNPLLVFSSFCLLFCVLYFSSMFIM